jgi:hypothetical protein
MGNTSNRGNNAQRGQFRGRGGKPQNQQRGGSNASASAYTSSQNNSITRLQRGSRSYRGNTHRGRWNFPKLKLEINAAPAGNPFVFDDLTLNMIKSLCAKKKFELEKINDIEFSKSRLIIYLKSLNSMENIPWLYNTGAQATCLSEKFFRKISKNVRPRKLPTN